MWSLIFSSSVWANKLNDVNINIVTNKRGEIFKDRYFLVLIIVPFINCKPMVQLAAYDNYNTKVIKILLLLRMKEERKTSEQSRLHIKVIKTAY